MRQLRLQLATWCEVKDGDHTARDIFDGHYSRRRYADGRDPLLFVGPGEKLVLVTPAADALFVWRKFKSGDGQQGVNCAPVQEREREAEQPIDSRGRGTGLETVVGREAVHLRQPSQSAIEQPGLLLFAGRMAEMRSDAARAG